MNGMKDSPVDKNWKVVERRLVCCSWSKNLIIFLFFRCRAILFCLKNGTRLVLIRRGTKKMKLEKKKENERAGGRKMAGSLAVWPVERKKTNFSQKKANEQRPSCKFSKTRTCTHTHSRIVRVLQLVFLKTIFITIALKTTLHKTRVRLARLTGKMSPLTDHSHQ